MGWGTLVFFCAASVGRVFEFGGKGRIVRRVEAVAVLAAWFDRQRDMCFFDFDVDIIALRALRCRTLPACISVSPHGAAHFSDDAKPVDNLHTPPPRIFRLAQSLGISAPMSSSNTPQARSMLTAPRPPVHNIQCFSVCSATWASAGTVAMLPLLSWTWTQHAARSAHPTFAPTFSRGDHHF